MLKSEQDDVTDGEPDGADKAGSEAGGDGGSVLAC